MPNTAEHHLLPSHNNAPTVVDNKLLKSYRANSLHGERPSDPSPRYPATINPTWLQPIMCEQPKHMGRIEHLQDVEGGMSAMRNQEPVAFRKPSWFDATATDLQQLHSLAAMLPAEHMLRALCSDNGRRRFYDADLSKAHPRSMYQVRDPETQAFNMPLRDAVKSAQTWEQRQLMFKVPLLQHSASTSRLQVASTGLHAADEQILNSNLLHKLLGSDGKPGIVHWPDFLQLLQFQRFGGIAKVQLEVMCAWDLLLPAKYSQTDTMIMQVAGRQRVLLIGPEWALQGLPPFPTAHTYDRYAMVDWDDAKWQQTWPESANIEAKVAILQPGDVLFVPSYMYVQRQTLEPYSATLPFAIAQGARPLLTQAGVELQNLVHAVPVGPAPWSLQGPLQGRLQGPFGAAALFVSRIVEAIMEDACGNIEDVRMWLLRIGDGRERRYLDDQTAHGYKLLMACQEVRDCVGSWFGARSWRTFLPTICNKRLLPTTWLNKAARDPLYLADKPVYIPDRRTDEERKYPQLFRSKLKAEGWEVPEPTYAVPTKQ